MGRIETDLLRYQEVQDEAERSYDPDDLSEVSADEVMDSIEHMEPKTFRLFMDAIHEQCNLDAGETLLDAIRSYRRLG